MIQALLQNLRNFNFASFQSRIQISEEELIWYRGICIWQQEYSRRNFRDRKISRRLDLWRTLCFLWNFSQYLVWQRGQSLNSVWEIEEARKYAWWICLLLRAAQQAYVILGALLRKGGGETNYNFPDVVKTVLWAGNTFSPRESLIKHSSLIKPECDLGP